MQKSKNSLPESRTDFLQKSNLLDYEVYSEILEDFEGNKKKVDEYLKSISLCSQVDPNPAVHFLEERIFPVLRDAMSQMLLKIEEEDSFAKPKSTFNGIDFLIFLKKHPRPFYPLSLIWTREIAATIIQANMRAYWERNREDVQELRQFWKNMRKKELIFPEGLENNEGKSQIADRNRSVSILKTGELRNL
ncbi:hypothetical protein JTB14_021496 [Gonioctena quinquepunctata]|nr:hypothetical protein JTB14_021496 [Gonioctena quinquepunctata]